MASFSSTVVEHLPHQPNVEGSSPASDDKKSKKRDLKINHVCLAEDRTRDLLINFTLISSLLPLSQAKPGQGIPTEGEGSVRLTS